MDNEMILRLFEVVYDKHQDKPMPFIQEELYRTVLAVSDVERRLRERDCECLTEKEPEDNKRHRLSPENLKIKDPEAIQQSVGEDAITCCICGHEFQSLGAHLRRTHGISAREYCELCGLPEDTVLMSKNYYQKAQQYAMRAFQSLPRRRRKNEGNFNEEEFMEIGYDDISDLPEMERS